MLGKTVLISFEEPTTELERTIQYSVNVNVILYIVII